ncbi:ABC transporter substrate-binding protein [Mycoplasmatota bacterium]|nr:ABC transporter substrate-binding protein [Mycoplasmatota bacterium]
MITKDLLIEDVLRDYPDLIYVFETKGFKGLDNELVLKQVGKMSLESVLKNKKLNVDVFVDLLNETLEGKKSEDITLVERDNVEGKINIVGLLPCPVRVPLLEAFSRYENINEVNYELRAASEGLDWLKEDIKKADSPDELADVFISAGFDLFFEEDLMKKFKDQGVFKDFTGLKDYNTDFENDHISLKDPKGEYSMLGVVPAVFLVNKKELGDRPMPKTWADVLDPIFEGSVSLPVSDFDLFNAILIHLYKDFGPDACVKLGKSLIESMHPTQMLKSEKKSARVKPAISIMPYFFTKMALPGSVLEAVWPEDGAIISPIFMLTKSEKKEDVEPIAKMFASREIGEIMSHKGLFPSVRNDIDNKLKNNKFRWIGWDYINSNDIGSILKECMTLFEKGMM